MQKPDQGASLTEMKPLHWQLSTSGSLEQISAFVKGRDEHEYLRKELPPQYDLKDVGRFSPSGAIYFMNGYSAAVIRLEKSGEELSFDWYDENTSIAASAPVLYHDGVVSDGLFVPVPPPLRPVARYPKDTPERYRRDTTSHLMQVVSMNMRSKDGKSRLLIGLPFAEKYPKIYFAKDLLGDGVPDASSYGVVQSLTKFVNPKTGIQRAEDNGYPARSFFGIYHLLETPVGAFFNKKPTQMELQPDKDGKLALALPPLPFLYELINGPIPLYSVEEPKGVPMAQVIAAKHGSDAPSSRPTTDDWPYNAAGKNTPGKK